MPRLDEGGNQVPGTLGEYLRLVKILSPGSRAEEFLEQKIAQDPEGAAAEVIVPDVAMRQLLMPMMLQPKENA